MNSVDQMTRVTLCLRRVVYAVVSLWMSSALASGTLLSAEFTEPTTRYAHAVLGDDVEWGALRLRVADCTDCGSARQSDVIIRLPEQRVFEDIAPRVVSINGRGDRAAMVVESDRDSGARLALYTVDGLLAATPYIGTRYRWLAPIGAADLDGDGAIEFAYVDRPHLAKVVRVWRIEGDTLTEMASAASYSNHRIGWDYIEGGLRDCGSGYEMILASGDWRDVVALRFDGELSRTVLAPYSATAVAAAMACELSE